MLFWLLFGVLSIIFAIIGAIIMSDDYEDFKTNFLDGGSLLWCILLFFGGLISLCFCTLFLFCVLCDYIVKNFKTPENFGKRIFDIVHKFFYKDGK